MNKKFCIDISNRFKKEKGIESISPSETEIDSVNLFSELWIKFGISEYDLEPKEKHFSLKEKITCLEKWAENLFPPEIINIDFLHRKIINGESSLNFTKSDNYFTATSIVCFETKGKTFKVDCSDLIPFEIDNLIGNLSTMDNQRFSEIKFNDYVRIAEKNLSYHNDIADETALKYFKRALAIKPKHNDTQNKFSMLDKIVNYKKYKYPFEYNLTLEKCKLFVECCNIKGFERLFDIISDDFICISRYFGRSKKAFIDSIYFERKSWQGLITKIGIYSSDENNIPCVILNDFGVLFFDIENGKIVRAIEKKIGETIDKNKLTEWKK